MELDRLSIIFQVSESRRAVEKTRKAGEVPNSAEVREVNEKSVSPDGARALDFGRMPGFRKGKVASIWKGVGCQVFVVPLCEQRPS
jgi:hypothetical protein